MGSTSDRLRVEIEPIRGAGTLGSEIAELSHP